MKLSYRHTVVVLFVLFLVLSTAYLHRVPGLMGDEASEGENVYQKIQILTGDETKARASELLLGERSYIGPAIDYAQLPFVWAFGYTTLALRVPVLIASTISFLLAASVSRRLFGEKSSLLVLALVFFSPMYLTMHRLSWAITLHTFFALLVIWLLLSKVRGKYFLAGAAAGLGLHSHILFLPTLIAITTAFTCSKLLRAFGNHYGCGSCHGGSTQSFASVPLPHSAKAERASRNCAKAWVARRRATRSLGNNLKSLFVKTVLFGAGFALLFGTQYVALRADTSDQGDPARVAEQVGERATAFVEAAPLYLSGSSYIARYTGVELPDTWRLGITSLLLVLSLVALAWHKQRRAVWLWALGLGTHLAVLLVMIDRFTLRYFTVFSLGVWMLAALGLATVVSLPAGKAGMYRYIETRKAALVCALALGTVFIVLVLVPFLQTGGSTNDFSLGNRTNSAADLADTRPLVACLRGQGTVSSENVHIWNRLRYFSHHYEDLQPLPEAQVAETDFLAHYRDGKTEVESDSELCPDLEHFIVERQDFD